MAAATILVTGQWLSADGRPLRGDVEFIPSVAVTDLTTSARRSVTRVTVKLDQWGRIAKRLTATTGPGVNPSGWTWKVSEHFLGVEQRQTYLLALPHNTVGGTVDLVAVQPLADIVPVVYGPDAGIIFDGGTP